MARSVTVKRRHIPYIVRRILCNCGQDKKWLGTHLAVHAYGDDPEEDVWIVGLDKYAADTIRRFSKETPSGYLDQYDRDLVRRLTPHMQEQTIP